MAELALIGGGAMGEALVRGILARRLYPAASVMISDPLEARRAYLASEFGVQVTDDNRACVAAPHVLLAVKPNQVAAVLEPLREHWRPETLLTSILAGKTLADLASHLPRGMAVVRVMPNTPSLLGEGMAALTANAATTPEQKALATRLFEAVGEVAELPEGYFDIVTGLSGSGPAYIFLIIEALIEAGVYNGLPRRTARQLVLQTVIGSTRMVKETGMHPAELKEQVTSPGGTTAAGLQVLEAAALRSILVQAVKAATDRSAALSGVARPTH
ncbi:MAG: pyrroline-5-carboxylate reductase [Candidatus Sericytochromatia bacterium]|nr:pyrroline-5-carboxylate reductase [Candidatus Sericytochromatia bacterium]